MEDKTFLCIDLKSFFASVECVERGLDPFSADLVVADPSRGSGAICLAISPAMKSKGIKNRCRLFEIPENTEYIIARPRMRHYMEVSAQIYSLYQKYINAEDIHVYSIDECFFDITYYLKAYRKTPREMTSTLMDAVFAATGLRSSAGIGSNMFLAKTALDIDAKRSPDGVGFLNEKLFMEKIQRHRPITDVWGIGHGIAKRVGKYGAYDLYGITRIPEELLYKEFGVNADELIRHANGRESCTIRDIHEFKAKSASLSNGQILFEDYRCEDALIVMKEMVQEMVCELISKNLVTGSITLSIGYSKGQGRSSSASCKMNCRTNSYDTVSSYFEAVFDRIAKKENTVRRINISLGDIEDVSMKTVNLFTGTLKAHKEEQLQLTMTDIKRKFGRAALLKGISYTEKATGRSSGKLIGGHNGE